jgi:hypothetical protein
MGDADTDEVNGGEEDEVLGDTCDAETEIDCEL